MGEMGKVEYEIQTSSYQMNNYRDERHSVKKIVNGVK